MEQKKVLINYLDDVINISESSLEVKEKIEKLKQEIEEYEVKIPLIGAFSAGKSSLINSILSEEILPIDILAKTSIATEIKYSSLENNVLEIYKNKKKVLIKTSEYLEEIDSEKYDYTTLKLMNNKLIEFKDITLVDMPGIGSTIESHNKAILNYISNASFFFVVMEMQDGQIKQSTLNFLYELDLYNFNFAIVLNKYEKIMEEDREEIIKNIKSIFKRKGFLNIDIISSSSVIENGNFEFINYLKKINVNEIIKSRYMNKILKTIEDEIYNIEIIKNNLCTNDENIDNEILNIKKSLEKLKEKVEEEKNNARYEIKNKQKFNVLNNVKDVLYKNSMSLTKAYLNGESYFKETLNNLLRPTLVSSIDNALNDINLTIKNKFIEHTEKLYNTVLISKDFIDKTSSQIEVFSKQIKNIEKFSKLYKVSAGVLAITTTMVAPWLELIIVFLPDILKLFGLLSEKKQEEKIKLSIENKIIPEILNKLDAKIEESLDAEVIKIIDNIEENYQERNEEIIKILSELKDKKESNIKNLNEKQHELACKQEKLKNIIENFKEIGDLK